MWWLHCIWQLPSKNHRIEIDEWLRRRMGQVPSGFYHERNAPIQCQLLTAEALSGRHNLRQRHGSQPINRQARSRLLRTGDYHDSFWPPIFRISFHSAFVTG